jgi:hypothetical protein
MGADANSAVIMAARSMAVDQMTAEVVSAFVREGISPILLKGPSIAQWLYPSDLRPYGDTDLLVSPAQFSRAARILRRLGFGQPTRGRAIHAHTYRKMGTSLPQPLCVDLHRSLPYLAASPKEVWRVLSADTDTMVVAGAQLDILGIPARTFHIAIHAVQHAFESKNPFEDLRRAVAVASRQELEQAIAVSRAVGAEDALAAGLCLIPEGVEVAAQFNLTTERRGILRFDVEGASDVEAAAYQVQRVLDARSIRERLALFIDMIFVSPNVLRETSLRARRGRTGLVLAYAVRPFVLLQRIGPALGKRRRILKSP